MSTCEVLPFHSTSTPYRFMSPLCKHFESKFFTTELNSTLFSQVQTIYGIVLNFLKRRSCTLAGPDIDLILPSFVYEALAPQELLDELYNYIKFEYEFLKQYCTPNTLIVEGVILEFESPSEKQVLGALLAINDNYNHDSFLRKCVIRKDSWQEDIHNLSVLSLTPTQGDQRLTKCLPLWAYVKKLDELDEVYTRIKNLFPKCVHQLTHEYMMIKAIPSPTNWNRGVYSNGRIYSAASSVILCDNNVVHQVAPYTCYSKINLKTYDVK